MLKRVRVLVEGLDFRAAEALQRLNATLDLQGQGDDSRQPTMDPHT
jgi:hypothetical protein